MSRADQVAPSRERRQTDAGPFGAESSPLKPLRMSPGPHIHSPLTTQSAMWTVVATLAPVAGVAVYFFGWSAFWLIAACIAAAVATEALCLWARRRRLLLWDGSAALTGLLLALTLPPGLPIWMGVLGSVAAVGIGKHAFGGLGANPFNPALVGRVFLHVSFAGPMTAWSAPFDMVTSATPLEGILATGRAADTWSLFTGATAGSLGETSAIALLLGGAILLARGIIDWRIPAGILGTTAAAALIAGHDPLAHVLSGGLLLGAIYMATDWVTSPITRQGKWIFAIGIGLITMIIRLAGPAPEGVSFAILFMNGAAPLLNALTRPAGQRTSKRGV